MGWGRAKVGPCRRSRAGCLSAAAADPSGSCRLRFVNSEGCHSLSRGWRPGRRLCSLWNGVRAPPLTPASLSHQVVNQMLDRTSSGNFAGNEGFTYVTLTSLPFSGVGEPCPPSPSSPNSREAQVGTPDPERFSLAFTHGSTSIQAPGLSGPQFPSLQNGLGSLLGGGLLLLVAVSLAWPQTLPCPCRQKWDGKVPRQVLLRHLLPPPRLPALPLGPGDAEEHPLPTLF